ncbi:hypothetical protein JKP88DRAFT_261173 [Tribonema minus]|uniref:Uncharacterized protein n=1 Tax=Tribonema minus TaxID=303371 RepID=A0A835YVB2_9STRA|nr:hypothetical protein JKP88DRAFT_261173 [Tribonema minus]
MRLSLGALIIGSATRRGAADWSLHGPSRTLSDAGPPPVQNFKFKPLLCAFAAPAGDWARVGAQLDRSVFLRVPRAAALRAATSRKVARGRDPADAAAHCARVDAPIYDALRGHEARAHVALTLRGCCEVGGGGGGGGDGGGSDGGGSSGARAGSEGGSGGGGGGRSAAVPGARHLALAAVSVRSSAAAAAEAVARAALRPPASPLPLLVLGLNPAVQRWFRLAAAARVGEVNRAAAAGAGAGGKGQNVAAALAQRGGGAGVVLAMFGTLDSGGGGEAAPIERAFAGSGVRVVAAPTAAGVRTCVTVIGGNGVTTELVGPWGGSVTAAEADALTRSLTSAAPAQPYKGVAVMGSLPPGVPPDYPATLLSALAAAAPAQQAAAASQLAGAHVVLDTTAAVPALLRAVRSAQAEAALKVNAEELLSLAAEAAESGGGGGGSGNGGGGGGSSGAGGGGSGGGGSGGSGGGDGGGGAGRDQCVNSDSPAMTRPENSLYDIADAEAFLEQAHVHKVWLAGGSGS